MSGINNLQVALTALLGAGVLSGAAQAQFVVDEITVTAQRREQAVTDVPLSITAFSGEAVERLGFTQVTDILSQVPNFSFIDPGLTPNLAIRGNGLIDLGYANEAPVALYFDDVYRGTIAGIGAQIFDVERVEVLRGPQGTLFGRNSTSGLVHFISKAPTKHFEGNASLQYGSYNQVIAEGALSGSLSDNVQARVAVRYNRDDGYQRNLAPTGGRFGAKDVFSARAQLNVDASEDVSILFSGWATRQRNSYMGFPFLGRVDPVTGNECSPQEVIDAKCVNFGGFRDPNPKHTRIWTERSPKELKDDLDIYGASAKINWAINEQVELVSITAYEEVKAINVQDTDSTYEGAFGSFQFTDINSIESRQFSQELRLQGERDNLSWVVGAFYYTDKKNPVLNVSLEELEVGIPINTLSSIQTDSWAVFGQIDVAISDDVTLTAGVRYTEDRKDNFATTRDGSVTPAVNRSALYEVNSKNTSGRLALEWDATDDLMLYASLSTGFKSGEFTTSGLGGNIAGAAPVADESITAYEVGFKWSLADHRLQINGAAFYTDVENKQGRVTTSISSNMLLNFGDLVTYGAELDLTARPTDNFEIILGMGLLDTKLKTAPDVWIARNLTPDVYYLDGNQMQGAPHVNFNGVVRYHSDLGDYGRTTLQADFRWQSKEWLDIANSPYDRQGAYGIVNLRAFWYAPSDRYYLNLFVENVFNTQFYSRANSIAGLDWRFSIWGSKPRWFGAKVGFNF